MQLREAQARVNLLNRQIAALRQQLARLLVTPQTPDPTTDVRGRRQVQQFAVVRRKADRGLQVSQREEHQSLAGGPRLRGRLPSVLGYNA